MRAARTFCEFDDVVTAPLHGFRDTDDYWTARLERRRGSSASACRRLLLNARNDPFLPEHDCSSGDAQGLAQRWC